MYKLCSLHNDAEFQTVRQLFKWQKIPVVHAVGRADILKYTKGQPTTVWLEDDKVLAVGFWNICKHLQKTGKALC